MRKRLWRTISILLCLSMICSISAYAAEARASSRISGCSATLLKKSNGDLSLTNSIVAAGIMDNIGASSVVIERYNGNTWVEEQTYSFSDTPELQTSGEKQYTVTLVMTPQYADSNYRAEVTFYAEDSSGSNTKPVTTNTV